MKKYLNKLCKYIGIKLINSDIIPVADVDSMKQGKNVREQAYEDFIKAKEKACSAYDSKLADSDYKQTEDMIRAVHQSLIPLVNKRNKIVEEAEKEYKRIMDEERLKSREKFRDISQIKI